MKLLEALAQLSQHHMADPISKTNLKLRVVCSYTANVCVFARAPKEREIERCKIIKYSIITNKIVFEREYI